MHFQNCYTEYEIIGVNSNSSSIKGIGLSGVFLKKVFKEKQKRIVFQKMISFHIFSTFRPKLRSLSQLQNCQFSKTYSLNLNQSKSTDYQ